MADNKPYFANLDAIRWIAALMVFLGHAVSPSYKYLNIQDSLAEKLLYAISDGKKGVSIFFVLSGFLITYLLISEYKTTARIALKKFYIRRVLRIWPLYYLVVAFSFFIYPALNSMVKMDYPWGSNVYYHLAFLSNFDIIRMSQHFSSGARSQDITWSVSVEEQFYLVWPLLFVLLPKRIWGFTILLVIAGSVFFRFTHSDNGIVLYFHSFAVVLDLAIGALFAYGLQSSKIIRDFFENRSTGTHLFLFIIAFFFLWWSEIYFSFANNNTSVRIFSSVLFAFIISAQALTKQQSKFNLGNWRFATHWGKYTYGIYLLHPIVMVIIEMILFSQQISPKNFITAFGIGMLELVLTLLLSKFIFRYYESYFLTLKEKFS